MVYYFQSTAVDPPAFIYVGKDKVESACCTRRDQIPFADREVDEDLIKYGWNEDVWYETRQSARQLWCS